MLAPAEASVLGQVFVHQVVEVPTVANLFAAAAATEPWPLGIDRLTQCCAEAPLQRIGDLFPFDESAPTDESVEMSRRGANLVKTPVFLFADLERGLIGRVAKSIPQAVSREW